MDGLNCTQECPQELKGISQEMSNQLSKITRALDLVSLLEEKISTVLNPLFPPVECVGGKKNGDNSYSVLANELLENNQKLQSINDRIEIVLSRIDY
jgi:hypothetical protein